MHRFVLLALCASPVLVACAPASVDISFEDDGIELLEPTDDGDIPIEEFYDVGGWRIDTECNDILEVSGNAVGEVTDGTALVDQFDEVVNIHDFCNRAVLIVTGAFW